MTQINQIHIPVLYDELIDGLCLEQYPTRRIVVDMTLGLWGHALGVIKQLQEGDIFIGFDAETRNLQDASDRISYYLSTATNKSEVQLIHTNFTHIAQVLADIGITTVSHIYADLWVSSKHFDTNEKWFSFRENANLDMRFDQEGQDKTAADILNFSIRDILIKIFREYGDEKRARFIAEKIIETRKISHYKTVDDLNATLDTFTTDKKMKSRIYQALRIAVNNEYGVLESAIHDGIHLLEPEGKMGIITFHSWEDRIVKHLFKKYAQPLHNEQTGQIEEEAIVKKRSKKPLIPTEGEIEKNPRSRSAKLRFISKK